MKKQLPWIAAAAIIFITFGTMYAVNQQDQRRDANYPQVQIAEDAAAQLNAGKSPNQIATGDLVDPSKSLASFLVIYDKAGKVVGRTGDLNGQAPDMPHGVLAASTGKPYNA